MTVFNRNLCIYHAHCTDGFTSALLVKEAHLGKPYLLPDENIQPYQYGQLPDWLDEKNLSEGETLFNSIFIVDFSFPPEILTKMALLAQVVIVCDHHKTFKESLVVAENYNWVRPENLYINYDVTKSGAQIVAESLNVDYHQLLVSYTADRDLWKWKLPESKSINAAIGVTKRDFEEYRHLSRNLEFNFNHLVSKGNALLDQEERHLDSLEKLARPIQLHVTEEDFYVGLVVNAPGFFASELGNRLAKRSTFGATYFQNELGETIFSLRSVGDFDVSRLAKVFNGGGHKNAAGFKLASPEPTNSNGVVIWKM